MGCRLRVELGVMGDACVILLIVRPNLLEFVTCLAIFELVVDQAVSFQ